MEDAELTAGPRHRLGHPGGWMEPLRREPGRTRHRGRGQLKWDLHDTVGHQGRLVDAAGKPPAVRLTVAHGSMRVAVAVGVAGARTAVVATKVDVAGPAPRQRTQPPAQPRGCQQRQQAGQNQVRRGAALHTPSLSRRSGAGHPPEPHTGRPDRPDL
jgi:hypothetical protein